MNKQKRSNLNRLGFFAVILFNITKSILKMTTKKQFDKRLDKLLWPIFTDPWCRMSMVKDIGAMVLKCKTKGCTHYKNITSLHLQKEEKETNRFCWSCGDIQYCKRCCIVNQCDGCDITLCDKCSERFPEEPLFKLTRCARCCNNYCGNCTTFTFTDECEYCRGDE